MAKTILLSKEHHKDLRIKTTYSAEFGDAVMWAPTFAFEFRNLQSHYPILFQKDSAGGGFFPIALFGLEQNENLFLNEQGWDCNVIPLMVQRVPFSIGLYGDDGAEKKRLIHIDIEHPKVSRAEGQPLFDSSGVNSDYLERMSGMLEAIHVWNEHNTRFMAALVELDLLEPVTMDIRLANKTQGQLIGFHTINEEKLNQLSGADLKTLNERNFLQPIYMAIASLSSMNKLIERKSSGKSSAPLSAA